MSDEYRYSFTTALYSEKNENIFNEWYEWSHEPMRIETSYIGSWSHAIKLKALLLDDKIRCWKGWWYKIGAYQAENDGRGVMTITILVAIIDPGFIHKQKEDEI